MERLLEKSLDDQFAMERERRSAQALLNRRLLWIMFPPGNRVCGSRLLPGHLHTRRRTCPGRASARVAVLRSTTRLRRISVESFGVYPLASVGFDRRHPGDLGVGLCRDLQRAKILDLDVRSDRRYLCHDVHRYVGIIDSAKRMDSQQIRAFDHRFGDSVQR